MRSLLLAAVVCLVASRSAVCAQRISPADSPSAPGENTSVNPLLPPPPHLLPLVPARRPPAAVLGMYSVPRVLAHSTAAQHARVILTERRQVLNTEVQREQAALQTLARTLADQRGQLSPAQARAKEQALQQRAANARNRFARRERVLREVNQYAFGHLQQTLAAVAKQVAESRGVNVMLTEGGVALNTAAFDLTDGVTEQLNKALPDVTIPPDGVSPLVAQAGHSAAMPAPHP